MSDTETQLSTALAALRKVGSPSTDDSPARVAEYLDAIALELARINRDR